VTALVDGETRRLTLTFDIFSELESALNLSINKTKNELWSVKADGETFVLTVRRYGHASGMSQRGAQQMANLGYTYDQILGFYYENCVRMQYTFTHTILPPVGDAPVTATEAPATISPAAPNQAMVTLVNVEDVLNVRLTASDNGTLLTTLPAGTAVTVLAKGDNWTLIRFGRIVGYVRTENLTFTGTPPTQSDENPTPITRWATVTGTNSLNLRASGSYDAAVQSTIPRRRSAVRVRGGERLGEHTVWTRKQATARRGISRSAILIRAKRARPGVLRWSGRRQRFGRPRPLLRWC